MEYGLILQIGSFGVMVAAGAVWLRSQIRRQHAAELQALADTRGETIQDLRGEINDLREEMIELRGQLKMLQALKTAEIVDGVLEGINHEMLKRYRGEV